MGVCAAIPVVCLSETGGQAGLVREEKEPPAHGSALERALGRFCAWRGASGRRYIASLYPIVPEAAGLGLPDYESFVLLAVAAGPQGRQVRAVCAIERASDLSEAARRAFAFGANEWHVHLLSEERAARVATVADLKQRHLP